uniref:GPS domain-containing protein n=1 Tax=Globodera pallida TaxID=36090 RepID=A0A183C9I1_GLOPA
MLIVFPGCLYIGRGLQIRECRIGRVDEGALGGLFTVGSVHLQSNQIVRLSPGWSNGMDNIGKLVFTYNTVREPMASTDCLRHEGAQRFEFADNTLHCSCALQWMINAPEEEQWLAENYCGPEENFKALLYFSPAAAGCAPWMPPPLLLQIRECRIGRVDEGALGGLFTVGSVHLQSNQIVRLSPGWSNGMDNIGKLVFTYNTVREPMASTDCLRHEGAQRFEFADNTLHCSCALQWMINAPEEEQWLAENYCGPEENFKALLYFSPAAAGCAPWMPPPPPLLVPSPAPPLPPRPSSSPSSEVPDSFSTVLERFDGRDKTIRSLYFTLVLIANRLRDQRKADQLMAFARQFSRTRLVCRMFSQPSLLLSVLRIPRAFRLSRDGVDFTLASSISVLYLFCGWTELIGLLTESGFVGRTTAHSLRYFGRALRLWVLALALSIIRCLRQIVRRTAANGLTWRKSDREWLKTQLISLVGFSADFVAAVNSLPRGMLWAGKMLPSHCASLHLAASVVGVFKQFM